MGESKGDKLPKATNLIERCNEDRIRSRLLSKKLDPQQHSKPKNLSQRPLGTKIKICGHKDQKQPQGNLQARC